MRREELRALWRGREPGLMGRRYSCAVLCPFVETGGGLSLLFEVRAASLRRQPGEVCFPGGRMEAGEDAVACALRETAEELSIPREEIEVLGLSDFICHQTGFLLQPVMGLLRPDAPARVRPSPAEVARVFTVPLQFFRETPPQRFDYRLRPEIPADFPYEAVGIGPDYAWGQGRVEVPLWLWQGRAIWGMTARIVQNILETLEPLRR